MVVVVAAGRGWATPKTSSHARCRGWQGGGGSKNPETSTNARFRDGDGRQRVAEPESEQSWGLGGWWQWWRRRAEGGQNPENEQACSLSGLGDGGGSQNPETSIHAHFGDGGGGSRQAEGGRTPKTSSRARFRGWEDGGGGGSRQRAAEPRKRAVVLAFGVGKVVVAARTPKRS